MKDMFTSSVLPLTFTVIAAFGAADVAQAQFVTNGNIDLLPAGNSKANDDVVESLSGSTWTSSATGTTTANGGGWDTTNGKNVVTTTGGVTGNATQYLSIAKDSPVYTVLYPNTFTGITGGYTYDLTFSFGSTKAASVGTTLGTWEIVTGTPTSVTNLFAATAAASGSIIAPTGFAANTFYSAATTFTLPGVSNYPAVYLIFNDSQAAGVGNLLIDNVSAVPEPESYAMLFAGLGALGFMGRRRKLKS
jgi:hypothetical protein